MSSNIYTDTSTRKIRDQERYRRLFNPPALSKKHRRRGLSSVSRKDTIEAKSPVCRTEDEQAYLEMWELLEAYPRSTDALLVALGEFKEAQSSRRAA